MIPIYLSNSPERPEPETPSPPATASEPPEGDDRFATKPEKYPRELRVIFEEMRDTAHMAICVFCLIAGFMCVLAAILSGIFYLTTETTKMELETHIFAVLAIGPVGWLGVALIMTGLILRRPRRNSTGSGGKT
jgi:hypothetical protein